MQNMATLKSVLFTPRCFIKRNFCSCFKNPVYMSHFNNFHTSGIVSNENRPLKYTTSKAAEVRYPHAKSRDDLWYSNYVILGSLITLLLYFTYLREENDLDEMLSADPEKQQGFSKLFQLQMQLKYCEQNHLPTKKIKEQIIKLKNELNIPLDD